MLTSKNGIELIKKFEGCKLKAYKVHSGEQYYTIGYGHFGSDVSATMTITQKQAEDFLRSDLIKFESAVNRLGLPLNQNQFDALVSFAYNCGQGNLRLLVRNRTLPQIADAMLLYNKSGGKVMNGLTKRRKAERELFLTKTNITSVSDDYIKIAQEVIAGKWGNGTQRRDKLTQAGYNYNEVQKIVNKLLKG